jgi:hypothetical protein
MMTQNQHATCGLFFLILAGIALTQAFPTNGFGIFHVAAIALALVSKISFTAAILANAGKI